jgi:hypothetical protein
MSISCRGRAPRARSRFPQLDRCENRPAVLPAVLRPVHAPLFAVLTAALSAGGCASDPSSYSQANMYAGGPKPTAAAVPIPIEMEDDGHPAQLPPRVDTARAPDDPSEPWSPNYGGRAAKAADRGWQTVVQPERAQPDRAPAVPPRRVAWMADE